MATKVDRYINKKVDIAPLVTLRVVFGAVMFISLCRFWYKGWIETLYLNPVFHFKYYGFEWVSIPSSTVMYALYICTAVSAFFIMLGLVYRLSSLIFFLGFTYIELMDKATYLNHYYFVSLIAFLFILVPANRRFSLDVLMFPQLYRNRVPAWCIDVFKLQMGIVYFYAGIAKLNADWLFRAQPLSIWLRGNDHLPVVGPLFRYDVSAYILSWLGMLYDLFVPFLLLRRNTRVMAYVAVVSFHLMTAMLFNIGMFPYIMIGITLVFFSTAFHHKLLSILSFGRSYYNTDRPYNYPLWLRRAVLSLSLIFVLFQLTIPFRYLMYPGNLYWTEQGFRFSWRVMLVEKAGYAQFKIKDPTTGGILEVDNRKFLTQTQEKQMSFQSDMILEYAHFLHRYYCNYYNNKSLEVYADVFVTLNGRRSKRFIDPNVNLAAEKEGFGKKNWILPMNE